MYHLPNINSSVHELADFLEIKSALSGTNTVSLNDFRSAFAMPTDEYSHEGVNSDDDSVMSKLEDALNQTNERKIACEANYPYSININSISYTSNEYQSIVYLFLLLSTRLNMQQDKLQAGIDATKVFEILCAEVARNYFGGNAKSVAFGTSIQGTFSEKVTDMLKLIDSRATFREPMGTTRRQKDAHLDVVTWIPFADKKGGQLIGMGQCKTGTSWEMMLGELIPENFFANFATNPPFVCLVRMFFVAEYFGCDKWEERSRSAGVIFDRCRIMQYLPEKLDAALLCEISSWTKEVINKLYI